MVHGKAPIGTRMRPVRSPPASEVDGSSRRHKGQSQAESDPYAGRHDHPHSAQALGGPLGPGGDGRPVTVAGFIVAQRAQHGVPYATSCRALGVSPAWFYKWRYGDASPRRARREQLAVAIRQLFAAHRGTYGSPRIADDLREAGWRVSEKTVAAIMRELRLVARVRKRRRHTTRPGRGRWRAPDLVGRNFGALGYWTTVEDRLFQIGAASTSAGGRRLAQPLLWGPDRRTGAVCEADNREEGVMPVPGGKASVAASTSSTDTVGWSR